MGGVDLRIFITFAVKIVFLTAKVMVKLRIKQLIASKGLTQAMVAQRLGVAPMTVSGWCTGRAYPSIEMLERIAEVLGVRLAEFFEDSQPPRSVTLQARVDGKVIDLTPEVLTALAHLSNH